MVLVLGTVEIYGFRNSCSASPLAGGAGATHAHPRIGARERPASRREAVMETKQRPSKLSEEQILCLATSALQESAQSRSMLEPESKVRRYGQHGVSRVPTQ